MLASLKLAKSLDLIKCFCKDGFLNKKLAKLKLRFEIVLVTKSYNETLIYPKNVATS
jgi:hypothetical protein